MGKAIIYSFGLSFLYLENSSQSIWHYFCIFRPRSHSWVLRTVMFGAPIYLLTFYFWMSGKNFANNFLFYGLIKYNIYNHQLQSHLAPVLQNLSVKGFIGLTIFYPNQRWLLHISKSYLKMKYFWIISTSTCSPPFGLVLFFPIKTGAPVNLSPYV